MPGPAPAPDPTHALAADSAALKPAAQPVPPLVPDSSLYVSFMLLGSVAFVMSLFYLLNMHDPDVRAYNWNALSLTIVTFIGVLIGMSWSTCFNAFVVGPPDVAGPMKTIACDALAALGWYVALQVVLAVVSGANDSKKVKDDLDRVRTVLNLKCFAVLLGKITGASNLPLWGLVQQQVPLTLPYLSGVILACIFYMWLLFKIGDKVRECISKSNDGSIDDFERLWDRFAEETEDGALSMTVAHLITQVVRFHITGYLPLANGQVRPGLVHTEHDSMALFGFGLGFAFLIPVFDVCLPGKKGTRLLRYKGWTKKIAGNCTSFCWLYAITWQATEHLNVASPPGAMILALCVTLFGFALIFFIDFITDLPCTGEATDREVKALVTPISLLIGFSWKAAFVASITAINGRESVYSPPIQTVFMAVCLAIVVVPAWRMYILPIVMHEEVETQQRRQKEVTPVIAAQSSKVVPLLGAAAPVMPSAANEAAAGDLSPGELMQRNAALARRNADLEASIREIRGELGNLKKFVLER